MRDIGRVGGDKVEDLLITKNTFGFIGIAVFTIKIAEFEGGDIDVLEGSSY